MSGIWILPLGRLHSSSSLLFRRRRHRETNKVCDDLSSEREKSEQPKCAESHSPNAGARFHCHLRAAASWRPIWADFRLVSRTLLLFFSVLVVVFASTQFGKAALEPETLEFNGREKLFSLARLLIHFHLEIVCPKRDFCHSKAARRRRLLASTLPVASKQTQIHSHC